MPPFALICSTPTVAEFWNPVVETANGPDIGPTTPILIGVVSAALACGAVPLAPPDAGAPPAHALARIDRRTGTTRRRISPSTPHEGGCGSAARPPSDRGFLYVCGGRQASATSTVELACTNVPVIAA